MQENVFASQLATDLAGRVVWYYPSAPTQLHDTSRRRRHILRHRSGSQGDPWKQLLREFNLIGLTIRETNAGRVNEQLKALGKRPINAFHHEALRLPDGNIAVLAGVEQILTGVQGAGAVNVLGDMVVVLDPNLNVVWTWDAFDHLDTHRTATLGEQCLPNACPPLQLGRSANDWTHANAIEATPDGNLLVSFAIRIGWSKSTTIRAKATATSSGVSATAAISNWSRPVRLCGSRTSMIRATNRSATDR